MCAPGDPSLRARRLLRGMLLVVAGGLAGCAPAPGPAARQVAAVERHWGTGTATPPAGAAGWTPVALPDRWPLAARRLYDDAWYRVVVPLAAAPASPWAVFLPRVVQSASVFVNGVAVGDGGPMEPPIARNWNRPLLFTVPAPLLHAGDNVVEVRVATEPTAPGFLRPFWIGPLEALQPWYAWRTWWQVGFVQIVGGSTLAGGLLLLGFSLSTPAFAPMRWIALALMLWAWTTADAFVREIPVSTRLWEWSTATALVWCPLIFAFGFHRLTGRSRRRLERVFVGITAATTVALLAVPALYAFATMLAGVALAVGLGFYVIGFGMRAGSTRRARAFVVVPAAAAVLVGLHDVVGATTGSTLFGMLLSPYLPLMAIGAAAWRLLEAHLASVQATEALARTLEGRVAEKHAELERNYARVQALERDRAVAAERERIMQDVHDGVGGQLVSALALAEGDADGSGAVTEVLRSALEDLRLVIDSLDPADCELLAVLGAVRGRLEPRLQRHDLAMRWDVREVPAIAAFGPEMALQVMRVVQEAVTNVVKHARARTITVRTGSGEAPGGRAGVFVEIEDDGCGLPAAAPRGRGLGGMERRASRLGGRLQLTTSPAGTTVRLWIPLDPGERAAS